MTSTQFKNKLKRKDIVKVTILASNWKGTLGILEDPVPETDWWNVRVANGNETMRLLLKTSEFTKQ